MINAGVMMANFSWNIANNRKGIVSEKSGLGAKPTSLKLKNVVQDGNEVTLVLKGDEHVPHGRVVALMDVANSVGVKKILITVRRK